MTKLLDQAFEALGQMPADMQNEIARALLGMAMPGASAGIEPLHASAVEDGVAQAKRGDFAARSAQEIVADAFRRHAR